MIRISFICLSSFCYLHSFASSPLVEQREEGVRVVRAVTVDDAFRNPWTPELEGAFQRRAERVLAVSESVRHKVNTYFENEKNTYGDLMLNYLATGQDGALKALQTPDHQREIWHKETAGIDWYAAFTIKHQIRKYFYFGHLLEPDYLKKMKSGADAWTEQDPLGRPHYAHKPGTTGWGPDAKNSWVDVRTTDNLWWMRVSSVYLMAEETGNRKTAEKYKDKIRGFVAAQYRGGVGEWDSQNYLGHATAPVHNLYDFAKDPEVKRLAKASLDHYYTAAALKYWRGGWNGPMKRDYNAVQPMTMSPAFFSLLLGLPEEVEAHRDSDLIHVITSAYRPPMAVMALAAREGIPGTEIYASHAPYSSAMQGKLDTKPQFFETQFYGHSYQLGTLAKGTQEPDANGFKVLAADPETGAEMIQVVPGPNAQRPGSPQYGKGNLIGKGRVAQFENLAIYLVDDGSAPWTWVLPVSSETVSRDDVWFIRHHNTYMAWIPLNISAPVLDAKRTEDVQFSRKRTKLNKKAIANPEEYNFLPDTIKEDNRGRLYGVQVRPRHTNYQAASAQGEGGAYCGFVLEVGESKTHESFDKFQQSILQQSMLNQEEISTGHVKYTGTKGKTVELKFGNSLQETVISRNGEVRNFEAPWFKYQNSNPELTAPVRQSWTDGTLHVTAGGHHFSCTVSEDGQVQWTNQ